MCRKNLSSGLRVERWQQIKIFWKSGIMKRFIKVHFCVLRCFRMPGILVIMIDTTEHWELQNWISLHTLHHPSESHWAKVTKIPSFRATGKISAEQCPTFMRTPTRRFRFVLFVQPKLAQVKCLVPSCEVFSNSSQVSKSFSMAKGTSKISGLVDSWVIYFFIFRKILSVSCCS